MTILTDERSLVRQLFASPRLPLFMEEVQSLLEDEAKKRQDFYQQITEDDKAEFINGEMIFHSPVKLRHNVVSGHLYRLLSTYAMLHDSGYVGIEKIMISLTRNDYEPDICFFDKRKAEEFSPDQMRFPAPDFIAEVLSSSTERNDRGVKYDDYAAHGVSEYWIVDPDAETVEQYELRGEGYELVIKAKTGEVQSLVIPGFEIPVRAIFDEEENRAALRSMLAGASA